MKLPSGWIITPTLDGLTVNLDTKELVMCKDCKYFYESINSHTKESYGWFCKRSRIEQKPYDYCSRGVRKDGMD